MDTTHLILFVIAAITALYEVVIRFVPKVKDITILGIIIRILLIISNALNKGVSHKKLF